MSVPSPFFNAGPAATVDSLAVLQLKRDLQVPVLLQQTNDTTPDGYAEGIVLNTRFGSFPHSTLIDQPWGSQILASKVDTGSRAKGRKRKRDPQDEGERLQDKTAPVQAAIVAGTGFAHLLQPTPESWTISLPHRTQVVYTPDYSYILQRLRVAPGTHLIEAGAGSGSFTHASARAVFNGHPASSPASTHRAGHVYSFEYHQPRVTSLREELTTHGLSDLVTVNHRDVYQEGFLLSHDTQSPTSPAANAIFLDLPAPWLALRNLTRSRISSSLYKSLSQPQTAETAQPTTAFPSEAASANPSATATPGQDSDFISPLDPTTPVRLCTFTPCIEQVQSVVSALRQLGWVEIQMVEIANRRLDIRRERVGYGEEGLKGTIGGPKDVEEAVRRLVEVEGRFREWGESMKAGKGGKGDGDEVKVESKGGEEKGQRMTQKQRRQERNKVEEKGRKTFKEGMLVHRTEGEVKAHTSYLVFAVLPVEWTEEDERKAAEEWGATVQPQVKETGKGKRGSKPANGPSKDGKDTEGTSTGQNGVAQEAK
ncbi:putative tRNA-methyltransferase complex subunit GCD14 [Elsinoe australis]|uniref:tRNA (adenine(58)-N(1))-methyltransferase catalytic subunit TRM61 n=1 Tax=Elsinoe australis TaxID=40998 RepID=A0A4V6DV31_9PEZI|nr:putative tRNA-methyltransferase complex subunit GCD14 [Elsinoe australis]